MGIKLKAGETYLFDNRNGNIHPYEPLLAGMKYMVPIVAEKGMKLPPLASEVPGAYTELSAVDKANEWDRLARMPKAKREAEEKKKAEAAALVKQPEEVVVDDGNLPSQPAQPTTVDPLAGLLQTETQPTDPQTPASVPKPPPPPATE